MATNSKFPTMGTYGASPVNQSGAPSKNTKAQPRKGSAGGEIPGYGGKSNRKGTLERNGFKGAPQTTISYPNAPEAAGTFRSVKVVRSAIGNRDFYDARQHPTEGSAFASPGFPSGSWTPPTKP